MIKLVKISKFKSQKQNSTSSACWYILRCVESVCRLEIYIYKILILILIFNFLLLYIKILKK